jgi:hypothetical protein
MYLFTRRTRLAPGHGTAGVDWARSVAEKVRALTGREIDLWSTVCSPGVGTIAWTGWFEGFQALERTGEVLEADASMEKLINAGTRYTEGGFDDGLVDPVFGAPTGAPVEYVTEVMAVAAGGSNARAIAAGVEVAQQSEAVTGVPTLFGRAVTGPRGAVVWLTGYPNATAMETAERALSGDPSWLQLLDETRPCYLPSAALNQATIYRRLG